MNKLDVGSAIDFLFEEKMKRQQKREEDRRRQKEILWVFYIPVVVVFSGCHVKYDIVVDKHLMQGAKAIWDDASS